ncbi:MAG: hypothetical protein PUD30_04405, partial [Muribaculaceae bacterium]|nr:hypothetical protein [Muribaculaceae bacterium]
HVKACDYSISIHIVKFRIGTSYCNNWFTIYRNSTPKLANNGGFHKGKTGNQGAALIFLSCRCRNLKIFM